MLLTTIRPKCIEHPQPIKFPIHDPFRNLPQSFYSNLLSHVLSLVGIII